MSSEFFFGIFFFFLHDKNGSYIFFSDYTIRSLYFYIVLEIEIRFEKNKIASADNKIQKDIVFISYPLFSLHYIFTVFSFYYKNV